MAVFASLDNIPLIHSHNEALSSRSRHCLHSSFLIPNSSFFIL